MADIDDLICICDAPDEQVDAEDVPLGELDLLSARVDRLIEAAQRQLDEDNEEDPLPDLADEIDVVAVKFVLTSVIDFLEDLKLSGEPLTHAGQLLKDCEALWMTL